ncbi:hypothetical protein [Pseudoalteromonas umbrosa]|uniref:hypothetical protein n=1 Tax=Pseudoalteromonas umbrosa TaxID=3048489 RepID=UPI0024C46AC6|nr:hypothetical protein [Pseudoalteromonas sp. B95]MDK1285794.1 hypothetical protein [Pseudoalteromonas sp. B95]
MKLKLNKKSVKSLKINALKNSLTPQIGGAGQYRESVEICWTHPAYAACRFN